MLLNFLKKILDYIYVKKCYICKKSDENLILCSKCLEEIETNQISLIKNIDGVKIYSAGVYEKNLRKAIKGLKYDNRKELAVYIARLMFDFWNRIQSAEGNTPETLQYTVIPVPLYKTREKQRGYNHMELVAREFCALSGYKLQTDLIKRVKNTKPQYNLTIKQREENLKNAFLVEKTIYKGDNLLLIDDILTTGSTISEVVRQLKSCGIDNLVAFTCSNTNI